MSGLGTDNSKIKERLKDIAKTILFYFSSKKREHRRLLNSNVTDEARVKLCQTTLGIHQSYFEIISFIKFIRSNNIQPEIICEIGTANAGTTLFLASSFPSVKKIICIDLYVKNKARLNYYLPNKEISYIEASSFNDETLKKVASILNNKKIDLLFIDGDHSYEGVKKDFYSYFPLTHSSTAIGFHDIETDYLTKYNRNTGKWSGEVPLFWQQLKHNLKSYKEFIEFENQDGQGIGAFIQSSFQE